MNKLLIKGGKKSNLQSLEKVLDLIYPQTCTICGKLDSNSLCEKCRIILEKQKEMKIEVVKDGEFYFQELMYLFKYDGIIRNLLLQYKFRERPYISKTFVNFLQNQKNILEKIKTFDIIVPVPISRKRKQERGYNQSLLIAKEIAKKTGQTVENRCLIKTKNIIEQSKLNKEQRKTNIENVYELQKQQIIKNESVLLIDDIYTTGSTVNECSRTLKKAHPNKIAVLVIAKD